MANRFPKMRYTMAAVLLLAGVNVAGVITAQTTGAGASTSSMIVPRAGAPASFADLVTRVSPAVVNISTREKISVTQRDPFEEFFGRSSGQPKTGVAQGLGSGFLISSDGFIVTNNHVISAHEQRGITAQVSSITVTLPDGREFKARVVGHDETSDLAVLKIDAHDLAYVSFGDSAHARVGEWVLAVGNPLGLDGTVTAGIISAIHRNVNGGLYDRAIQTDAAINQGNSGGPLFDMNGQVIGINYMIESPNGGSVGLGFAIPAEIAKPIVEKLRAGESVHRGYLGVVAQELDSATADSLGLTKGHGALVQQVMPNGSAAKAGVKPGDVILSVGGQDVTHENSLSFVVSSLSVGKQVQIDIVRAGKREKLSVTLAERPSEQKLAALSQGEDNGLDEESKPGVGAGKTALGMALQPMTPAIAQQLGVAEVTRGLVVAEVNGASDAAERGIARGDIIRSVNNQAVNSLAQFNAAVAQAKAQGRSSVLLSVQRRNAQPLYVAVRIEG
jgi:serine protease Do